MKAPYLPFSLFAILGVIFLTGCAGSAFKAAKEQNTISAYSKFIDEYPDSEFASEAKKLKEEMVFEKAKTTNSISEYDSYLKEYPNGSYVTEANKLKEDLEFKEAKQKNTVEAYNSYLKKYPDGIYAAKAKLYIEQKIWGTTVK